MAGSRTCSSKFESCLVLWPKTGRVPRAVSGCLRLCSGLIGLETASLPGQEGPQVQLLLMPECALTHARAERT